MTKFKNLTIVQSAEFHLNLKNDINKEKIEFNGDHRIQERKIKTKYTY
jgi:hypothetical protein